MPQLETPSYCEQFTDIESAQDYEQRVYATKSHSSLLWEVEKLQLDEMLHRFSTGSRHLDFACGTGRVAGHLAGRFEVTGVDISEAMVKIARSVRPRPNYLAGDIMDDDFFDFLTTLGPFDSITAFRFILNADRAIVGPILERLCKLLGPQGIALVNNHGDTRSIKSIPSAIKGLQKPRNSASAVGNYLSPRKATRLFDHAGLRIADVASTGVLPGKALPFLGFERLFALERSLLGSPLSSFGTNTMYALRAR